MNHKIIGIIVCLFSNYVFASLEEETKKYIFNFLTAVINNRIHGKIDSRHIPYLKSISFLKRDNSNASWYCEETFSLNFPQRTRSDTYEKYLSIFSDNTFGIKPEEMSLVIFDLKMNPEEELRIANIMHAIRPGIIKSNPTTSTLTVRYHDEEA